jgi:hypothetical protein
MSLLKANSVQIGQSATATQNFTLSVPSSPDGTIKLARGNSGSTTADILSVSNDGRLSFSKPPTGSIIQVVQYTFTTQSTTTSSSYTDTVITGSITPLSDTSKILVSISTNALISTTGYSYINLVRGSTQVIEWGSYQATTWSPVSLTYLDSPSASSSVTYKVQQRVASGSGTAYVGWGSPIPSVMVLQEVA